MTFRPNWPARTDGAGDVAHVDDGWYADRTEGNPAVPRLRAQTCRMSRRLNARDRFYRGPSRRTAPGTTVLAGPGRRDSPVLADHRSRIALLGLVSDSNAACGRGDSRGGVESRLPPSPSQVLKSAAYCALSRLFRARCGKPHRVANVPVATSPNAKNILVLMLRFLSRPCLRSGEPKTFSPIVRTGRCANTP